MYAIDLVLTDNPYPLRLCDCETPDGVAEVVRVLCKYALTTPITITRLPDAPPKDEGASGVFPGELT